MKGWRWATVVARLVLLFAAARWGDVAERNDPYWFLPSEPVVLYFAAPDAAGLVPEIRWLPLRIRSVTVEGDLAVVDFDGELVRRHPGGSAGEILTVFSVVNTLTEIPGVRRVAWRIDGRAVETLVGHLDLSRPVERDPSLILSPDRLRGGL